MGCEKNGAFQYLFLLTRVPGLLDRIDGITFHEPFGFFDYVKLQQNALCTLSDSGTISEESAILGFRAVTIRESMERPESLDTGSIVMASLDLEEVIEAITATIKMWAWQPDKCSLDYQVTDTSDRVVKFILSTVRRHHDWAGVRITHSTGPRSS
jgi:UDP-N-acetyl-L-fucosamine synthase